MMKKGHRILGAVFFVLMVAALVAFTAVAPFTMVDYRWQCAICGFFGLLWIICLLIELATKETA